MPCRIPSVIEPSELISRIRAKIASASASRRSVSASTYQDPPSGSETFVTPVSSMITCWVRSAVSAAASPGSASTSSRALVCSELVPPSTAARASTAVRTMLLSGCGAVSETPAVWVWKRSHWARAVVAPYTSRSQRAQIRRAARNWARWLREEVDVRVEEERQAGGELVHVQAAGQAELHVAEPVGQRERQLLGGRRARFPDVVAGHRQRLVARDLLAAVLHQ